MAATVAVLETKPAASPDKGSPRRGPKARSAMCPSDCTPMISTTSSQTRCGLSPPSQGSGSDGASGSTISVEPASSKASRYSCSDRVTVVKRCSGSRAASRAATSTPPAAASAGKATASTPSR